MKKCLFFIVFLLIKSGIIAKLNEIEVQKGKTRMEYTLEKSDKSNQYRVLNDSGVIQILFNSEFYYILGFTEDTFLYRKGKEKESMCLSSPLVNGFQINIENGSIVYFASLQYDKLTKSKYLELLIFKNKKILKRIKDDLEAPNKKQFLERSSMISAAEYGILSDVKGFENMLLLYNKYDIKSIKMDEPRKTEKFDVYRYTGGDFFIDRNENGDTIFSIDMYKDGFRNYVFHDNKLIYYKDIGQFFSEKMGFIRDYTNNEIKVLYAHGNTCDEDIYTKDFEYIGSKKDRPYLYLQEKEKEIKEIMKNIKYVD